MNLKQKKAILEACRATGRIISADLELTYRGSLDLSNLNDMFIAQAVCVSDYNDIYDCDLLKKVCKKHRPEGIHWFLPDNMSGILFDFVDTNKSINPKTIKKLEEQIQQCYYEYLERPEVLELISKEAKEYL